VQHGIIPRADLFNSEKSLGLLVSKNTKNRTMIKLASYFMLACGLGAAQAQMVSPQPCTDSAGHKVAFIATNSTSPFNIANTEIDQNGQPFIRYAKPVLEKKSSAFQHFVLAHECAHHELGHVYNFHRTDTAKRAMMETEADCHALRKLGFGRREINIIAREDEKLSQPISLHGGTVSWSKPSRRTILESCSANPK